MHLVESITLYFGLNCNALYSYGFNWQQALVYSVANEMIRYRQIFNIRGTKSQNLIFFVSSCSYLWALYWSNVLSQEWRCRWSSAGRRCSNYIWVINNFIAYWKAPYIRDLTVYHTLNYHKTTNIALWRANPTAEGAGERDNSIV